MRPRTLASLALVWLAVAAVSVLAAASAWADVVRIEIRRRDKVGPHTRIVARVFFAIDPGAASNRQIADIALAPRNAQGLVEFSADLLLFLPDPAIHARGTTFLEVVNRGRDQSLGLLSSAVQRDLAPEHWELGDRFVLNQGFVLAFLGWQFDVKPDAGLTFQAPIAPVDGVVRGTYIGSGPTITVPLRYCAADPNDADATLSVRGAIDGPAEMIPRARWRFSADGCSARAAIGAGGGLFEVVYRAHGSPVAGLGLAALRDFASYLKYGGLATPIAPTGAITPRVIGFGYSQSGRLLREFVRDGFNQDTSGRQAFDGLFIASAGAGVGSFNHRFAWPGDAGNSVLSILRPVDVPPFTDDDLLVRARADHVVPRIFSTLSSTEYWARAASLALTNETATADAQPAPTSRVYLLAGTPHSGGPFPPVPAPTHEHPLNFAEQRWTLRALVLALDDWIRDDRPPPASQYPTIAAGNLVAREGVRFPAVRSLPFPAYMPPVWRMDYGPEFRIDGVITHDPPRLGAPYVLLVPQVDEDGLDLGGVRVPDVAAPLGTFTGWNVTKPALPQLGYLAGLVGSFEPFARTKRDRDRTGDARLSLAERYKGRSDYAERVRRAAIELVGRGFALPGDVDAIVERAKALWDAIVDGGAASRSTVKE